jgi:uncharacterized membrane protein
MSLIAFLRSVECENLCIRVKPFRVRVVRVKLLAFNLTIQCNKGVFFGLFVQILRFFWINTVIDRKHGAGEVIN